MYEQFEKACFRWLNPGHTGFSVRKFLVFSAISVSLMFSALILGPYPITKFPLDTAHFMVQGDYLLKGYRPYVDYSSMHGPFAFLFSAAGMSICGVSTRAIVVAQVLGASLFGLLMFKIAINRLHNSWAILLAVSVELILLTCTPLGSKTWREFTCAMWYNAIGYVMHSIIFLYLLLPSNSSRKASRWLDSAIVAFCLGGCLLTKLSFFLPVAILFVVGAIVWPRDRQMRLQGIAIVMLASLTVLVVMGPLGGSVSSYFRFLDSLTFRENPLLLLLRYLQYTRSMGVFLFGVLLITWLANEAGLIKQLRREWLLMLMMCGTTLLSASTSSQDWEILPMLGVVPLGITVLIGSLALRSGRPINFKLAASAFVIALLLVVHSPKNGALSLIFSHMQVPHFSAAVDRHSQAEIDAMDLALPARVDREMFTIMPKSWVVQQLSAIRLLDDYADDRQGVIFVATALNSIVMLTDFQNAVGQAAWWPFMFTASPQDVPPLHPHLLEDADWILRDLHDTDCWTYLQHHRSAYIDENFELAAKNDHWELYSHKKPVSEVALFSAMKPTHVRKDGASLQRTSRSVLLGIYE